MTLSEVFNNVDWTSVGASAFLGATLSPGMSTSAKITAGAVIVADAGVDINTDDGVKSMAGIVGKEKPISEVTTDLATDILPPVVCNSVTRGFTNAINSKSVANLTKETKAELKQVTNIINSDGFQKTAGVIVDYETGIGVGKTKNGIKTQAHSSKNRNKKNLLLPNYIPPPHDTKVKVPELILNFIQNFDAK